MPPPKQRGEQVGATCEPPAPIPRCTRAGVVDADNHPTSVARDQLTCVPLALDHANNPAVAISHNFSRWSVLNIYDSKINQDAS